jgi:hypothetical protein
LIFSDLLPRHKGALEPFDSFVVVVDFSFRILPPPSDYFLEIRKSFGNKIKFRFEVVEDEEKILSVF